MAEEEKTLILFNDRFVEREEVVIDLEDRGYQFGDGVYEVVKIYNGKPFQLAEHMKRLERSLNEIRLPLPYDIAQLKEKVEELLQRDPVNDGIVYLQVTRGAAKRVHAFPAETKSVITAYTRETPRPVQNLKVGIGAHLTNDIRWLRCDIKSLNLLGNVLAKQEALDNDCGEAIFHRGDMVTEGSSSNVFVKKDGSWYTHPATNLILNGITRQLVIKLMKNLNMPVKEEAVKIADLLNADEVIVTSTTQEVMPVVSVDGEPIGSGDVGEWTKKLQEAFEERISQVAEV
ncbi:MAG: D-amino-acid transaminase [Tuberibacillus sp.]